MADKSLNDYLKSLADQKPSLETALNTIAEDTRINGSNLKNTFEADLAGALLETAAAVKDHYDKTHHGYSEIDRSYNIAIEKIREISDPEKEINKGYSSFSKRIQEG